jgi:hypothetical protein
MTYVRVGAKMTDEPNILPLVVAVPMRFGDNPALTGSSIPPVLTVQMDTESGPSYLVQLTEKAARDLLQLLANWQPIQDYLSKQEPTEPV